LTDPTFVSFNPLFPISQAAIPNNASILDVRHEIEIQKFIVGNLWEDLKGRETRLNYLLIWERNWLEAQMTAFNIDIRSAADVLFDEMATTRREQLEPGQLEGNLLY
jgi:hypothetical protein